MIINISNKSAKDRVITCIDNGSISSYPIKSDEKIEFTTVEPLAEIECDGTVILVPTIFETSSYTIIDDKDIVRGRKQADMMYIIILIVMCALTVLFLKTNVIFMVLFLIIQALIITGAYKILKTEQLGEVVFIER